MQLVQCLQKVEEVEHISKTMMFFMQDLLDQEHMENNKFTLDQNIFNFFDAMDEAFSFVGQSARNKEVTFQPPDVPLCLKEYYSHMYGD